MKLILGHGLRLAALGVIVGIAGVLTTTRLMASLVYGISPTDPRTLAGGILMLLAIGVLGASVPAL